MFFSLVIFDVTVQYLDRRDKFTRCNHCVRLETLSTAEDYFMKPKETGFAFVDDTIMK